MNKPGDNLMSRRKFVNVTASGIATTALLSTPILSLAAEKTKIKAVAFDAFPIFDSRPVFALVNSLYPDKGIALSNTWRTAQFEYTWLRTTAGQYKNFWQVTEDALIFAAKKNGVELNVTDRKKIMESYLNLNAWPDVLPTLNTLKEAGIRLFFLSNMTAEMLSANSKNAKLEGYFEYLLSTDKVKAFKPSPAAYQMGIDSLKLKQEEIAFAAFAGWDAVGAKWFGYPTFWVNRQNMPLDELSVTPDGTGPDLTSLASFVKS
jgi:2-haloacid dehalogenase